MSKIIDLIDSYIDRDPAAKGRIETLVYFTWLAFYWYI